MLLDENMLPRIKREIPQVQDLLQAEQGYLDVVLDMAGWLEGRLVLLKEEVMNIPNLRAKIQEITGWDCDIMEDAEHLTLTIRYYFNAMSPAMDQEPKILTYIPAHLKVIHEFLMAYAGQASVYAGTGMGYHTSYEGHMQEINGTSSGTAHTSPADGLYTHTKTICFPEV